MRIRIIILFTCLFTIQGSSLFGRDYWGLRRLVIDAPDSLYTQFNAHYFSFSHSWARTELEDDEYNWAMLDQILDFAHRLGGEIVMHIEPSCRWATGGQERAPDDINRRTPLSEVPPERGYSEAIYDFVYTTFDYIYERNVVPVRYLRYGPEPQHRWVTTEETFEQDVEDYIRCLRTVYIAAHAVADEHDKEIFVTHGGLYYVRQLELQWFEIGEDNNELQDSLFTLFRSRYERHSFNLNGWRDLGRWVRSESAVNWRYWTDALAGQTEWMDWFDVHYHWKPRFILDELQAFEHVVQDSGGEIKPWLAIEAAMQLEAGGQTRYEERFHAGDMARKWILGIAFGLDALCTPIIGWPEDRFFGLYSPADSTEFLAAQTWRFLRSYIQPIDIPEDMSFNQFKAYRFNEEAGLIDVIWYDALFDTDTVSQHYVPDSPEDFKTALVFNALGEELGRFEQDVVDTLLITQEPVIIVWDIESGICDKGATVPFEFEPVYPNPFNSRFNISFNLNIKSSVTVRLFTLDGAEVWCSNMAAMDTGRHKITVDGSNLSSGIFILTLKIGNCTGTSKIVLMR